MARSPRRDESTFTVAADEIAEVFGLGAVQAPMAVAARGEQGVIWRLDTDRGPFAVKELLMPLTEEDVARDVAFSERAAAVATTFDVARTLRSRDGAVLADVVGRLIRVQTWLDMGPVDPLLDPVAVGTMLAELHAAGETRTDKVDDWFTAGVGETRWWQLVERLQVRGAAIAGIMEAAVPRLVQLEQLLEEPTGLRTCHRDLWADNVRAGPASKLCVFDWDNCGPADPSHELAMVAYEFGVGSAPRIRALVDAYTTAGGPGRIEDARDLTMVIAQFGHFYEMAIEPFLADDPSDEALRWAWGRIDMLEDPPLTPDAVDELVAACRDGSAP